MDAEGNNQIQITDGEYHNRQPAWHPGRNQILFESQRQEGNTFHIIDLESGKTHKPAIPPAYVTSIEDVRPEIYVMGKDGGDPVRITTNNTGDTLPY